MEAALHTLLSTDVGVGAIVGLSASARIYPLLMPQGGALPAVTYQRISTPRIDTASLLGNNARVRCRMQVDCWASTFAQAKALADAVRAAMTASSTFTALAVDERHTYEDDTRIYRASADYSCWYLD